MFLREDTNFLVNVINSTAHTPQVLLQNREIRLCRPPVKGMARAYSHSLCLHVVDSFTEKGERMELEAFGIARPLVRGEVFQECHLFEHRKRWETCLDAKYDPYSSIQNPSFVKSYYGE